LQIDTKSNDYFYKVKHFYRLILPFALCVNLHWRKQSIWTYCKVPAQPHGVTCWFCIESSIDWQIRHMVWFSSIKASKNI